MFAKAFDVKIRTSSFMGEEQEDNATLFFHPDLPSVFHFFAFSLLIVRFQQRVYMG